MDEILTDFQAENYKLVLSMYRRAGEIFESGDLVAIGECLLEATRRLHAASKFPSKTQDYLDFKFFETRGLRAMAINKPDEAEGSFRTALWRTDQCSPLEVAVCKANLAFALEKIGKLSHAADSYESAVQRFGAIYESHGADADQHIEFNAAFAKVTAGWIRVRKLQHEATASQPAASDDPAVETPITKRHVWRGV
jgi:tetratricopeptide (TPR) repeat protein